MNIQNAGLTNSQDVQRQDPESESPESLVKRRFRTEQGGVERGSRSVPFSRLGGVLSNLTFSASRVSGQTRTQRGSLEQSRANSGRVHALLDSLAAPLDDARAQFRIAKGLAQLSQQSAGDLTRLPGARESLGAYLSKLEDADLFAFYAGALGSPDARAAVLDLVGQDLRDQAEKVLDQMVMALNRRLIHDVLPERLSQIARLPSVSSRDGQKLEELLAIMRSRGWDDAKLALSQINNGLENQQGLDLLVRTRQTLERELDKLVEPSLTKLELVLLQAVNADEKLVASKALYDLSLLVGRIEGAYGSLSQELADNVRKLVKDSLAVFRDSDLNPEGALNDASLSALDGATLAYLRHASSLHSLGLELAGQADAAEPTMLNL